MSQPYRGGSALLGFCLCLGLLAAAASPALQEHLQIWSASGRLAVFCGLAGTAWYIALRRLSLDPVRGSGSFHLPTVWIAALVGLGTGGYGAVMLATAAQRHVTVAPAAWLLAASGLGAGVAPHRGWAQLQAHGFTF